MKKLYLSIISAAFALSFGAAGATGAGQSPQISAEKSAAALSTTMYVGVDVDVQGRVTRVQHQEKLPSDVERLLRKTLDKWITKPAIADGRRVASQILVTVNLNNKKKADGNYQTSFAYVSAQPVPKGNSWSVEGGKVVVTGGSVQLSADGSSRADQPQQLKPQNNNSNGSGGS